MACTDVRAQNLIGSFEQEIRTMRLERLPAASGKQEKEAPNTKVQKDRFDRTAELPQGRLAGPRGSVGGEGSGLHIKE